MRRDRDGPRRLVCVPGSGDDSTLMYAPQATIRGPMMKRERGPSRQQTAAIFVGFCPDATAPRAHAGVEFDTGLRYRNSHSFETCSKTSATQYQRIR